MTEIDDFLNQNICKYLVDYFKNNVDKSQVFNKRYKILLDKINDDNVILNIVKLYKNLRPQQILKNIELIKCPKGESMDWHTDTAFYDITSITYLNQDYKGGSTYVEDYCVKSQTGKIILFDSSKKHKVTELKEGSRFVLLAWYSNG